MGVEHVPVLLDYNGGTLAVADGPVEVPDMTSAETRTISRALAVGLSGLG